MMVGPVLIAVMLLVGVAAAVAFMWLLRSGRGGSKQ